MNEPNTSKRPLRRRLILGALVAAAVGALLVARMKPEAPSAGKPEAQATARPRSGYENRGMWRRAPDAPGDEDTSPTIRGTAYDNDGAALAGVAVSAMTYQVAGNMPTAVASATTDAQGHFEIRLRDGSYTLTGDKDGYGQSLAMAHTGDDIGLVLQKGASIEGHVYDEQHRPVRRFTIDVVSPMSDDMPAPAPLRSKTFDSPDGSYRIDGVAPWPLSVRASSAGHAPGFSGMLAIRPGKTTTADIVVSDGCVMTGTVEDKNGAPLGAVFVDAELRMGAGMLGSMSMDAVRQAESDATGAFRLEHVPTGDVLLRGYDGAHAVTSVTVHVDACDKLEPVKLRMTDGGAVAGVVRGRDGKPIAGAKLSLTHRAVGFVNTLTDAEGRYRFSQLPVGGMRLDAQHQGQHMVLMIGVKDGEVLEQDIKMSTKGTGEIRGRVTSAGKPIKGLQLLIGSNHGAEGMETAYPVTAEDGTYRQAGLQEGAYMVMVTSTGKVVPMQVHEGTVETVDVDLAAQPEPVAMPEPPQDQPPGE